MSAGTMSLYGTSIGKKAVMAVSGFIMYGYVLAHMYGNLKMFAGPEAMNSYAEHLRILGEPFFAPMQFLWLFRAVMLAALIAHVWSAVALTRQDRAARATGYRGGRRDVQATFASSSLRWGGVIILAFLILHLLQLTIGGVDPRFDAHDPYGNVLYTFRSLPVVIAYSLGVGAVAIHLYHGVWSMFQTLGLNTVRTDRLWRALAVVSAILLFVGFMAIPVAVQLGALQPVA